MGETGQLELRSAEEILLVRQVQDAMRAKFCKHEQPAAWDIVSSIEREFGWKARWAVKAAVEGLKSNPTSKGAWRAYVDSLINSGDLDAALRGSDAPKNEITSSLDSLLRQTTVYQCCGA